MYTNRKRKARWQRLENTFKLQPDKKPKELDVTGKRDGKERTVTWIYVLSGDTLNICAQEYGKGRPPAIGTAADDERHLVVLKRVKGDDEK